MASRCAPFPIARASTSTRRRVAQRLAEGDKSAYTPGAPETADEILMQVIDRRAFRPTSEECPFCRDAVVKENGSKCVGVCRNPQNVAGPLVYPHQMQSWEDAVNLILWAMRDLDIPRRDHGVQVMWEYAVEHANMERSRFFGFSSDMYHFDHFQGKALAQFADFVRNTGHEILGISTMDDGRTRVDVRVSDEVGAKSDWVFIMVKRTFGKYEGCIQAHRIVRADSKYLPEI
jgi:hypothetical protein